jgi:signal peptidase I
VGVVLSLFISGAAPYLAGQRAVGLAWFLGIFLLQAFGAVWLASRWLPGVVPGYVIGVVVFVLWVIMLVKSYRPLRRLNARTWVAFVILAVTLPFIESAFSLVLIHPFAIPTGGMSPTIQGRLKREDGKESDGDRLWVEKYAYWFNGPRRGDIVVFKAEGLNVPSLADQYYVKRVVGLPGDVLTIRNGRLCNHGKPVSEPAVLARMVIKNPPGVNPPLLPDLDLTHPDHTKPGFLVPPGHYFVIGDNTGNSYDSRFWGTVPERNIIGRVSKVYWPLNRAGRIE